MGADTRHNLAFGDPSGVWNHDAAMRIGGGLRGGRSILQDRPKIEKGQVRVRITTTSDRHRQLVVRNERRNSLLLLFLPSIWRRTQDNALRHFASREEPPQRNEQFAGERNNHGLALLAFRDARAEPLCESTVLLMVQEAPG